MIQIGRPRLYQRRPGVCVGSSLRYSCKHQRPSAMLPQLKQHWKRTHTIIWARLGISLSASHKICRQNNFQAGFHRGTFAELQCLGSGVHPELLGSAVLRIAFIMLIHIWIGCPTGRNIHWTVLCICLACVFVLFVRVLLLIWCCFDICFYFTNKERNP